MVIKINYRLIALVCALIMILCIFVSADFLADDKDVRLPVIMYHHISKDPSALNAYVISPEELENDIKYLKQNGFEFILPKDVIAYTEKGVPLPGKPVMITFDDGFESVLKYAYPLCKKYGLKFVVALIGSQTDLFSSADDHNISYSYLTWQEAKELSDSGYVQIANHTYDLHSDKSRKGINIIEGENQENYEKTVSEDILLLQNKIKENLSVDADVFVYPFGFTCAESNALIKKLGFKISFSCYEGVNYIKKDKGCLYCLKRYNRPHGITTFNFLKKII